MKAIRFILLGFLFSLSATYTILAVFASDEVITTDELFRQYVIAAILGPFIGLGSLIFYVERLTLFWQLFMHYLFATFAVIVAGAIGNWYDEGNLLSIGRVLLFQLIIYVVVWVILNIMLQRDVKAINQDLKRRREKLA